MTGNDKNPSPGGARYAFRALDNEGYRRLFGPQTLSSCGLWMQHTAQAWLVYRLSNSPGWLGAVTFLTLFPVFLFSLWAGVLGDRLPRGRILLAVNFACAAQSLALGLLTWTESISVPAIAVLALILGVLNAFEIPTRQALVLDLVSRESLPSAVALNSTAFNLARLVGPAMAGFLIPWKGEAICFFANGLTYVPLLVALYRLDLQPARVDRPKGENVWQSLVAGLNHVRSSSDLRSLLALLGATSLFGVWFPSFLPVFAREAFGGGAPTLGLTLSAIALGSLVGGFALANMASLDTLGFRIAAAAVLFSIGIAIFANLASLPVALPVLLGVGFAMVTLNVGVNTMVQSLAPDHLRGRIISVHTVAFLGIGPVGALGAGLLSGVVGVPAVLTGGGIACLLAALLGGRRVARISTTRAASVEARGQRAPEMVVRDLSE